MLNKILKNVNADGYRFRQIMISAYTAYQSSVEWLALVKAVNARDGGVCRRCGQSAVVGGVVHHEHYSDWGKGDAVEAESCVLVCRKCHGVEHRSGAVDVPFWARRAPVGEIRLDVTSKNYLNVL